jgi:Fe-S-cluster-containing dehydrogenase component
MRNCLVIDLDRCTGCDTCVVACKHENGVDLGVYWNHVVTMGPYGTYPDIEMYWLPTQCQQCANAPCISVCPTGASQRDPDTGAVVVDKETCIGCQTCISACPYGARTYLEDENIVVKCTLCNQLTRNGEDPACVHDCCTGARLWGDLDDENSDVAKYVAAAEEREAGSTHRLPDPGDAQPSTVYILSSKTAEWRDPE